MGFDVVKTFVGEHQSKRPGNLPLTPQEQLNQLTALVCHSQSVEDKTNPTFVASEQLSLLLTS